jgi:glycerol-1-phosphate dehydrogenase [NAD(P)+]
MNGWVSANASIVRGGNKISVSAFSPARVLLDDALLAAAPATLTAAGFADALCGPFACRDWLVAHLADATDYEPTIAAAIMTSLDPLASALAANASRDTLRPLLVDALLTGGLAMSEAHSSAPASGAEHLVAHAVDLLEIARGARPTLHGHAVAIGTLLVAALWEVVGDELRALGTAASRQRRVSASVDERATALGTWLPTLASDAENIVRAKHARERERRPMHAICTDIRALAELPSVAQVRARLRAAGAPTHAADIHVDGAFLRMALLSARDMRDRTTVFDLAHDLGVLPARLDEVVARSKLVER